MPSTTILGGVYERATTQRNLTIVVAILLALPTSYAFQSAVGGGGLSGDFLLLMTLAVGVPTAYDEYWPRYDATWKAIEWVVLACAVATVEFTVTYLASVEVAGLAPVHAGVVAFLVTDVGNLAWLAARKRRR